MFYLTGLPHLKGCGSFGIFHHEKYDEYKDLKTPQIAELVKDRIRTAITEQEHAQPA